MAEKTQQPRQTPRPHGPGSRMAPGEKAKDFKGTIRGDFAVDVNANVIHGSDCLENAEIEIKRFFG